LSLFNKQNNNKIMEDFKINSNNTANIAKQ